MFERAGEAVDASRWPLLAQWMGRIRTRPAFQACLAEEERFFDVWQNTDTYLPTDGAAAVSQLGR